MSTTRKRTAATDTDALLVHIDPTTLIMGANVRLDARVDKGFVGSIRERGVLEPVVAYRDDNSALVVLHGQRRTLGAVQAERPTIAVMVIPKPAEPDRLVDQVSENDHRAGISVAERVTAYEQLAAFGVGAAQIAKRMATSRADVDKALAVAHSALARRATARWDFLTLDQAAIVAEFEDDQEAVKQLVVTAQRGGFDHRVQQLRDARAEAAAKTVAADALTTAGVTVVDRPGWDDKTAKRLADLENGDVQLTEDNHASCPGHAAYLSNEWTYPDTDDADSNDTDPDADADDAQEEPTKPYRAWSPVYVCTDFATHGHTLRWGGHASGTGRKTGADVTDDERETARAERRDVIQSNKDWDSAETVRRQWLRTFLTRKKAPATAAGFIAGSLARTDHAVTQALTNGNRLAHDLLGLPDQAPTLGRHAPAMVDLVGKASDSRAHMIALGLILAAYEEATSRNSWRNVSDSTARYLRFLQAHGYELSTVERRACGEAPQQAPDAGAA